MNGPPRLLGAVLAGGRSRRYGSDKTGAVVGGIPLVERAARSLAEVVGDDVVVVSSRGDVPGWPTIPDLREDCGPLGGIEAALAQASERGLVGVLVLACDLPLVTPRTLRALVGASSGADAVAPARVGEPPVEPLCAVYRVGCRDVARDLLDEGRRDAGALFASVEGRTVALEPGEFLNVNTPAEHERAEAELLRRRSAE